MLKLNTAAVDWFHHVFSRRVRHCGACVAISKASFSFLWPMSILWFKFVACIKKQRPRPGWVLAYKEAFSSRASARRHLQTTSSTVTLSSSEAHLVESQSLNTNTQDTVQHVELSLLKLCERGGNTSSSSAQPRYFWHRGKTLVWPLCLHQLKCIYRFLLDSSRQLILLGVC